LKNENKDTHLFNLKERLKEFHFFQSVNYRIIFLSWAIMHIAVGMPESNFQYYVEALGGSGISLGIIGLCQYVVLAIVAIPGGYLADKYGRRWLIVNMTFVIAFSHVLNAIAPTWHLILLGTVINSFSLIYQPALLSIVQDSLKPKSTGMSIAIIRLTFGLTFVGAIIAVIIFPIFGKVDGMRVIYTLMIVLYLGSATLRIRLKETMKNNEPIRFRYFIDSFPKAFKETIGVWKFVPRTVLWISFSRTLFYLGFWITNVINALYARDILRISEAQWWLIFIPYNLTLFVSTIPIGWAVDKIGRKIPLILGFALFAVSMTIFTIGDYILVVVSMCLINLAQIMIFISIFALLTDHVKQEYRGKVNGFNNFTGYIMTGVGMFLGGYLYENYINQSPFYISIVASVIAIVAVVFFVQETKKRIDVKEQNEPP
jgi:DHA1 family tetracycline resistance protein-like MFS transporter